MAFTLDTHSHSHGRTQTDRDAGREARGDRRERREERRESTQKEAGTDERERQACMHGTGDTDRCMHACLPPVSATETGGQGEAEVLKS